MMAADLARNNPALFIAGSIALGFGLSRFLKAGSAPAATFADASDPASRQLYAAVRRFWRASAL